MRNDVRSLSPAELAARVKAGGEPSYRAEQVFRWLHEHAVTSWEAMTNVPPRLRAHLAGAGDAESTLNPLVLDEEQVSTDGTRKMRFRTGDGRSIESVLIPEERTPELHGASGAGRDKLTLCVSSQVGCALDCGFCATATLGFGRNLSAGEIVQQVYIAAARAGRRPTNLVFMGMGEPMHNFEQVVKAFSLLIHPWGAAFSPRRITVSTAGVVPKIGELGQLSPAPNLAISLNATTDEVRDRIMPINRKWPIATLLQAARDFPLGHGRKVTFEYVLLAGVNDADADAERLPRLLKGMPSMVNLIPWNPFSGPQFQRPTAERIRTFQEILRRQDMQTFIRTPRGDDIDAACGQLAARAKPGGVPASESEGGVEPGLIKLRPGPPPVSPSDRS
jgi:23S rRNA (adenine2503-C2)-methyltransferase